MASSSRTHPLPQLNRVCERSCIPSSHGLSTTAWCSSMPGTSGRKEIIWSRIISSGWNICRFFFSSRRRHTRWNCDWSSDVCSSDLAYDCAKDGWLHHSRDGQYVFVGDSGDVIDTKMRKTVTTLPPLANTRKFIEIDFEKDRKSVV